jgi:hypothetical protein
MKIVFKKIKNIILGWYFYLFGINFEKSQERLVICNVCEFKEQITKKHSICSKCGCYILAKTRVQDEQCPEQKW